MPARQGKKGRRSSRKEDRYVYRAPSKTVFDLNDKQLHTKGELGREWSSTSNNVALVHQITFSVDLFHTHPVNTQAIQSAARSARVFALGKLPQSNTFTVTLVSDGKVFLIIDPLQLGVIPILNEEMKDLQGFLDEHSILGHFCNSGFLRRSKVFDVNGEYDSEFKAVMRKNQDIIWRLEESYDAARLVPITNGLVMRQITPAILYFMYLNKYKGIDTKKSFKCPVCEKKFDDLIGLAGDFFRHKWAKSIPEDYFQDSKCSICNFPIRRSTGQLDAFFCHFLEAHFDFFMDKLPTVTRDPEQLAKYRKYCDDLVRINLIHVARAPQARVPQSTVPVVPVHAFVPQAVQPIPSQFVPSFTHQAVQGFPPQVVQGFPLHAMQGFQAVPVMSHGIVSHNPFVSSMAYCQNVSYGQPVSTGSTASVASISERVGFGQQSLFVSGREVIPLPPGFRKYDTSKTYPAPCKFVKVFVDEDTPLTSDPRRYVPRDMTYWGKTERPLEMSYRLVIESETRFEMRIDVGIMTDFESGYLRHIGIQTSEPVKSVSFRYTKKVAHLSVSGAAEMACRRNQVKVSGGDILEVRKRSKEDHCQDQEYTFWLTSHVNWNGVSL